MASSSTKVHNGLVKRRNVPKELYLSKLCRSENGLIAVPVVASTYGRGLPYAPENWPCSGDEWHWKVVGNRSTMSGHWSDRYLIPPSRFCATNKSIILRSKQEVIKFIKTLFLDVEPDTFLSMFIWSIRAKGSMTQRGAQQVRGLELETLTVDPTEEINGIIEPSLALGYDNFSTFPNFYHDSCCIICGRTVDYSFRGYNYIKCKVVVGENNICGHVGHLDCAFQHLLAGTVGGGTPMDVQYYCRRCDSKTNLMMHVYKLLETCLSLRSKEEIKPILDLGLNILSGSRQPQAKNLENYMGLVMSKINSKVDLAEDWKMDHGDGMEIPCAEEFFPPTTNATMLGDEKYPYQINPHVDHELQGAAKGVPGHT
ncbi:uncharacterized protein [Aegilops tauschii subsp. strangulata]|uniref:uncharacterized protein n=1 Tax=Aegilops tauschii subsp. strangulata TaxID=200361 RepID=UPI001ABC5748|nr:uncharacterized protein LOC109778945 [Aegilops tauschii subsp. strangulata]